MGTLILNGVYDLNLLQQERSPDVKWGMDFRARSPQFISFESFKNFSQQLSEKEKMMIIFEEELASTVFSFVDLIKKENPKAQWCLQFRDHRPVSYYQQFETPFSWKFNHQAEWKEILGLQNLESLLLPVSEAAYLTDDFWQRIDARGLDVHLHFDSFQDLFKFKNLNSGLTISIDLTNDVETSYRHPNLIMIHNYLRSLNEKRKLGEVNENLARQ